MNEDAPPRNANLPIGKAACATQESGVPRQRPHGWHSRGYVPHFESFETIQHVTIHLADSLPNDVLQRLDLELKRLPSGKRKIERRKRIDSWIDAGHGCCVLGESSIAEMAQTALLSFHQDRYRIFAWVIMPNHMHVLFEPLSPWTMAEIVTSWKKFTARKISDYWKREAPPGNANLPIGKTAPTTQKSGVPVWHREYWDRYIRNEQHLHQVVEYIHQNPVKTGLEMTPEAWRWSSAFPGNAALLTGRS